MFFKYIFISYIVVLLKFFIVELLKIFIHQHHGIISITSLNRDNYYMDLLMYKNQPSHITY